MIFVLLSMLVLQLPFLLGVPFLEKLAAPLAPIIIGRTGSQLFLTDGKPEKPPLLLRMASDCEDGKFMLVGSRFMELFSIPFIHFLQSNLMV